MTSGTFLRSTVLPTCNTTNASSGMRQSARPRARAFGASEKNARSTPNGTTLMRRSSPSHILSSRFSHSVPTMYDRASRSAFRVPRRNRFRTPSRQPSVGERRMMTGIRSCTVTIAGRLKRELATWLGDDRRISVVPFGVDRAFFSEAPNARARGRADWRIPDDAFVVLHVGSTVERKNVPLVIHTVARLRAEADAYLLQVGGRFSNDQQQLIERLGLRRFVRTVPLADESTLRRAYRAADVLLFPSLYEGFGYPVIEAFASGLPVVTSGAGGLKEVGGDAVVVVEGRDPGAYVAALESLSDDPLRREELVERGRALARTFTWQRTAEQTADVYRSLL